LDNPSGKVESEMPISSTSGTLKFVFTLIEKPERYE